MVWTRSMEDKIRRLCAQILAARYDDEVGTILIERRNPMHQHIEHLRDRTEAA
jgi:hypothetical protein